MVIRLILICLIVSLKIFKNKKKIVEQKKYFIDQEFVDRETHKWYYFSVESVVTNLVLKNDNLILNHLIKDNNRKTEFGKFKNFKDGEFHEEPEPNEIAVYIQLYIDDVSRTKSYNPKTNLVMIYLSINNMPFELQLEEIQLLMIGTKYTYSKVKRNRFLRPLINELRSLLNKTIQVSSSQSIKIRVATFDGDNLALNGMRGITECFYRTAACRDCLIHYDQLQKADDFDLYLIERPIDDQHVLHRVVDRQMIYSHDPFHDLIEGVFPKFLWYVIKKFYSSNDVQKLNEEMKKMKWHNGRIQDIDLKKSKFKCSSGMQFLEFFIQFSYLDFKLDKNGVYFKMYVNLRKILCNVMSLELTQRGLDIMHANVIEFIKNFINYCEISVTFKINFMIHYRKFIMHCGPIWFFCTLRFERMHRMLLNMIKSSLNSCDIPSQIIKWYLIKKSLNNKPTENKFKLVTINSNDFQSNFITPNTTVKEFSKYKINRLEFVKNNFYIIEKSDNAFEFGKIFKIYEDNNQPKILIHKYKKQKFIEENCCYLIQPTREIFLLNLNVNHNFFYTTLYTINLENGDVLINKNF